MASSPIFDISALRPEIPTAKKSQGTDTAGAFAETMKAAIADVDDLQKTSEAAQTAYVQGEDVELHNVLIRIEEAELAFKTMMEVRNKLVSAYQEVMRMGSGG